MSKAWAQIPLGELLRKSEDWIELKPEKLYREVKVKLWGKGVVLRGELLGSEIAARSRLRVRPNQFIVSRIDARNGAFGLIPEELDGAVVTNDFPVFEINADRLQPTFLGWMCKTPWFVDACRFASEGSTNRVRLKEDRFLAIKVPLPPLAEQRHIVVKVEAVAVKLDEAKRLRSELLRTSELLQSRATAEVFAGCMSAPLMTIRGLAEVRGGIQKSPGRTPSRHPVRYVTVAHVQRNRLRLDDPRFFEVAPEELDRWRLKPGDVLIIEGNGSSEQIGRTALFRGEIEDCVHQNHVIRIRPRNGGIDSEFLNAFLNSPVGQEEVQKRSRTTVGLRNLSVGRIQQISVPVPSLADQRRIVSSVEALQGKVGFLATLQSKATAELGALLPSVLDRAFKGEL